MSIVLMGLWFAAGLVAGWYFFGGKDRHRHAPGVSHWRAMTEAEEAADDWAAPASPVEQRTEGDA